MAFSVKIILTKRPNLILLKALERNSPELDRIGSTFLRTLEQFDYQIASFREELETRKLGLFSSVVVDSESAKINDRREMIGTIHANHTNMSKFSSSSDKGFIRVVRRLTAFVNPSNNKVATELEETTRGLLQFSLIELFLC